MALTKALKSTVVIGGAFFVIRLMLAIIYGLNAQSVKIESYGSYIINVVMSIALAIGALSDLGLMIGSVMENKILLYIWIGAQFLVGKEKVTMYQLKYLTTYSLVESVCKHFFSYFKLFLLRNKILK